MLVFQFRAAEQRRGVPSEQALAAITEFMRNNPQLQNPTIKGILNQSQHLSPESAERAMNYLRIAQEYARAGNNESAKICLDLIALQLTSDPTRQREGIVRMLQDIHTRMLGNPVESTDRINAVARKIRE